MAVCNAWKLSSLGIVALIALGGAQSSHSRGRFGQSSRAKCGVSALPSCPHLHFGSGPTIDLGMPPQGTSAVQEITWHLGVSHNDTTLTHALPLQPTLSDQM